MHVMVARGVRPKRRSSSAVRQVPMIEQCRCECSSQILLRRCGVRRGMSVAFAALRAATDINSASGVFFRPAGAIS
jgi:hypothetical protein